MLKNTTDGTSARRKASGNGRAMKIASPQFDLAKRYSYRLSQLSNTLTLWTARNLARHFPDAEPVNGLGPAALVAGGWSLLGAHARPPQAAAAAIADASSS